MNTMPNIKLLTECSQHIPQLAKLHYEEIGRHWVPDANAERAEQRLMAHMNRDKMPLTLVALQDKQPIGMVSLRENDGIRSDLVPWLGGLVVDPSFRGNQIGKILVDAVKKQAKLFNYQELYLFAFDQTIPHWYARLGWKTIGMEHYLNHPVTVMEIKL